MVARYRTRIVKRVRKPGVRPLPRAAFLVTTRFPVRPPRWAAGVVPELGCVRPPLLTHSLTVGSVGRGRSAVHGATA